MVQEGVAGERTAQFHVSGGLNKHVSKTSVHLEQLLVDDLAAVGDRDRSADPGRWVTKGCRGPLSRGGWPETLLSTLRESH